MIDVIIPAYNAHKTICNTLFSICMQKCVKDINVTIVDDCSLKKYDYLHELFDDKINLNILRLDKNSGPGKARQYALDNTSNPYIVFIDADDCFVNAFSVKSLIDNSKGYDIVFGNVFTERSDGALLSDNLDKRVLHGKLIKREFLNKYDINFSGNYRGEDTGFIAKILMNNAKVNYIDADISIYKFVSDSITRSDSYIKDYNCLKGLVSSVLDAFLSIKDDIEPVSASYYAFLCVYNSFDLYYCDLTFDKVIILKEVKPILEYYDKYKEYIDEDYKKIVYRIYRITDKRLEHFFNLVKNA